MTSVALGTVHVGLELRLSKLRDGIRDAKRELSGLEGSMRHLSDVTGNLGRKMSLSITAPLLLVGKSAVETAVRFDSLRRGIIAVEGSADEARKSLARLREIAKLPGLGLEEAQEGYIRLRAVKLNADLAQRSLMAFGNALATIGRGKSELDGINLALTQIVGKGKVQAEEINQIAERLPSIRQAMKDAFGTADTEVLQGRGLTPEQFITAIIAQLEKLPKVTGGAQVAFENFSDTLKELKQAIGDAILPTLTKWMENLTGHIQAATKWFNELSPAAREFITTLAGGLAVTGPILIGVSALINALVTVRKAFIAIAATAAFRALIANPYTLAPAAAFALNFLPRNQRKVMPTPEERGYSMDRPETIPPALLGQMGADQILGNFLGVKPATPRDVRITPSGQTVRLMQRIQDLEGLKGTIEGQIAGAGTNEARNKLGAQLAGVNAELEKFKKRLEAIMPDPEKVKRDMERVRDLNAQAAYDLSNPVQQAILDRQSNLRQGMSRPNAERLFRKEIRSIMTGLDAEDRTAARVTPSVHGLGGLSQVFQRGGGDVTPQVRTQLETMMRLLGRDIGRPGTDVFEKQIKQAADSYQPELEQRLAVTADTVIQEWWQAMFKLLEDMATSMGAVVGKIKPRSLLLGQGDMPGGSIFQSKDVGDQLKQAAKEAKAESSKFTFPLGQELGSSLAFEMGRSFSDAIDSVFGTKSPLARALSRTLGKLIDDLMYHLLMKGFGNKLMLSLFGGGAAGAAGAASAAGGAAMATAGGAAAAGAAGATGAAGAGASAGVAWGTAFGIAAAGIAGAILIRRLFGPLSEQGRWAYGLTGFQPKFGGFGPSGGMGTGGGVSSIQGMNPVLINFYNAKFNRDQDPRRTAESVAWHVRNQMVTRPGSG